MSLVSWVNRLIGTEKAEKTKLPTEAVGLTPEVAALSQEMGNASGLFSGPEQLAATITAPGHNSIGLVRTIRPNGTVEEKYEPVTTESARARRQAAKETKDAPQAPKSAARRKIEEDIAYQENFLVTLKEQLSSLESGGHLPSVRDAKRNDIVRTNEYLGELRGNLKDLIAAEASGSSVPNAAAATIGAGETSTSGFGQAATKLSQAEQVLLEMIAERSRLMNQRNAYGSGQESQRQLTDGKLQALTQQIDEVSAQVKAGKQQLAQVLSEDLAKAQMA